MSGSFTPANFARDLPGNGSDQPPEGIAEDVPNESNPDGDQSGSEIQTTEIRHVEVEYHTNFCPAQIANLIANGLKIAASPAKIAIFMPDGT